MPVVGAVHRIKSDIHGVISRPLSGGVSVSRNLSGITIKTAVRVNGIDTPDIRGLCEAETELAKKARDLVIANVGDHVELTNIALGQFAGRIIADVALADGRSLAALLITEGLGREYDGGRREGWCDGE